MCYLQRALHPPPGASAVCGGSRTATRNPTPSSLSLYADRIPHQVLSLRLSLFPSRSSGAVYGATWDPSIVGARESCSNTRCVEEQQGRRRPHRLRPQRQRERGGRRGWRRPRR